MGKNLEELGFDVVQNGRYEAAYPQITITENYLHFNGASVRVMTVAEITPLTNDDEAWLLLVPAISGKKSLRFAPNGEEDKHKNAGKTIGSKRLRDDVLRLLESTGRDTRGKRYHVKGDYSYVLGGLLFDLKEAVFSGYKGE